MRVNKRTKLLPKTIEIQNIRKKLLNIFIKLNPILITQNNIHIKHLQEILLFQNYYLQQGLRVSEVSNIKYNDFNLNTGNIKVLGKGGKRKKYTNL